MKPHIIRFLDDYFRDIETGDAGIFAGAGLSVPAGFVDWRDLLRPLANEIDLDISRESDLVAVAQFHVNAKRLSKALGTTPEFWLNLQTHYDLLVDQAADIEEIKPLLAA